MLTEDNLSEAMQDAIANLSPPTVDLVSGGVARGRAIRRRKIGLTGAGTTLVVLALAAGVAVVQPGTRPVQAAGGGSAMGGAPTVAPSQGTDGSAAADTKPAPTGKPTTRGTGSVGLGPDKAEILQTLQTLLPAGFTVSDSSGQQGYAQLVATDTSGSVLLEVNVQPGMADQPGLYPCPAVPEAGNLVVSDPVQCQDLTPTAGGHLLATQETDSTSHGNLYCWTVDYGRPDGVRIVVAEYNSRSDEGTGAPSRSTQALSIADLATIAQSPLWSAT